MDELVLYVTAGDPEDKQAQESLAAVLSLQKSHHYTTFRQAECPINGAALSGFGYGERLFAAANDKALINCYSWGKEGVDQRFAVPEPITCLAVAPFPMTEDASDKPQYRTPWLLAGGSKSGRLYVWELALGDLVCVKDVHYQAVSVVTFSQCGSFLVTGGMDTRVNVWRTHELIKQQAEAAKTAKPVTFGDHLLAVTCVRVYGRGAEARVVSGSRDGTLRIYEVTGKRLLTTFVVGTAVECFQQDPAGRALYAGLADGRIRLIALYSVNAYTHVLEAVGGNGKIVTVEEDVDMNATFVHHAGSQVTAMGISMDGMYLVSGDSKGRVFVADIVTRQVVKTFTACKLAIAYVQVGVSSTAGLATDQYERKHRMIPALKRVVRLEDAMEHVVVMQVPEGTSAAEPFDQWLQKKAAQERRMQAASAGSSRDSELQLQLDRLSDAYSTLREDYDELLQRVNTS